jgi:hypothetical protein
MNEFYNGMGMGLNLPTNSTVFDDSLLFQVRKTLQDRAKKTSSPRLLENSASSRFNLASSMTQQNSIGNMKI